MNTKQVYLILFAFLCFISTSWGQSREKELQLRIGAGGGAYGTRSEFTVSSGGISLSGTDTSGAATAHLNIDLRYDFTQRFTAGLDIKSGSYLYDASEDNTGKSNVYAVVGLKGEFNIVSREKFRWYLGAGVHRSVLEIVEKETTLGVTTTEKLRYTGSGVSLNTGLIKYFGDSPFGIHFSMGYDGHRFELQEYSINDSSQNLTNVTGELWARGVDISAGILFRIRP